MMSWITSVEKTYTSEVAGNLENAVQFQGSGVTNNVIFRVEEPSGAHTRLFQVIGSLDGVNWPALTSNSASGGVVATTSIAGTATAVSAVGELAYPFYQVVTLTETHPKTFTITMTEEI
tara:strand:+ start:586 stop:942 length:357 start_codon:yes stop_codon:yes gene_type:complete